MKTDFTIFMVCLGVASLASPIVAQETYVAKSAVLKIKDQRSIASSASGIIAESNLFEGQKVEESELLMSIDSRLAQLELKRLQRELEIAEKDATSDVDIQFAEKSRLVAQADLDRARSANRRLPGAYPTAEVEKLSLLVEKSVAEKEKAEFQQTMKEKLISVKKAEHAIGLAKVEKHKIRSPIQGEITEILKRSGEWVDESEVVAKVISMEELIVEVKIPVRYAVDRFESFNAVFVASQPSASNNRYPAKLHFIHPDVNPINSTIKVWFAIDNSEKHLFPGMSGAVHLSPRSEEKVVDTAR